MSRRAEWQRKRRLLAAQAENREVGALPDQGDDADRLRAGEAGDDAEGVALDDAEGVALWPPRFDMQLVAQLSDGSQGAVYLTREHAAAARLLVLKVRDLGSLSAKQAERAAAEHDALAVLAGRGCAYTTGLVDSASEGGRTYTLTHFLPRGTMADWLKSPSAAVISEHAAQYVAAALTCGLEELHSAGYIHRDLKPANVAFDADGRPVLIDLGLCAFLGGTAGAHASRASSLCGTIPVLAPEVLAGSEYGAAVDCWAMGVVVGHLLLRSSLFDLRATSIADVQRAQVTALENLAERFASARPALSPEALDFVRRLLDPNPVTRMDLPQAKQHAWVRCVL